jgi:Short-chain alcohol dehydrogenase of unknown specificity
MMAVNTDGVFYLTRAALPALRESGGHLVYVGSFAGKFARPYNPVYAATKWWVRGFAKSVSAQVGDDDIGVSIINPAAVRTEFEVDGKSMADRYAPARSSNPPRWPTPSRSPPSSPPRWSTSWTCTSATS